MIYNRKWPLREDIQAKLSYIIAKKKISLLKIKEDDNIDILYLTHLVGCMLYKLKKGTLLAPKFVCMYWCMYLFRHHKKMFKVQIKRMGALGTI